MLVKRGRCGARKVEAMIHFGTGGWRAVIGDEFTKENVVKVAQGLCDMIHAENRRPTPVVIGHDRRFLSEEAAKWIAEVLCANGIRVIFIRRSAPTPLVMFNVQNLQLHYGIEVTASHNPPSYNGIKIIVDEGRDAPVSVTERLERFCEDARPVSVPFAEAENSGMIYFPKTPFNGFLDSVMSHIDMTAIRNAGLRILFDTMHGSGTFALLTVLSTARCTVDLMNSNKDAWFGGGNPAPDFERLTTLRERVAAEKYDLGIAVDGDGDRVGIVDPTGRYLSADNVLVMLYWYLHEYRHWKGAVVRNIATTRMLDLEAEDFGEKCYEVPVGFKYISEKMDEVGAVLGGESSGGLTVRGHINGKDSVYAASLIVEMVAATGMTPCEIMEKLEARYGRHCAYQGNFRFEPSERERISDLLLEKKILPEFPGFDIERVGYADGCKVYFRDGSWVICRFSGTEPLVRIFSESGTPENAGRLALIMKEFTVG